MASSSATWLTRSRLAPSRRSSRARWPSSAWRTSTASWLRPRTWASPLTSSSRRWTSGSSRTSTLWSSASRPSAGRRPTTESPAWAPRRPRRTPASSPRSSSTPARTPSACRWAATRAPPSPASTSATPGTCRPARRARVCVFISIPWGRPGPIRLFKRRAGVRRERRRRPADRRTISVGRWPVGRDRARDKMHLPCVLRGERVSRRAPPVSGMCDRTGTSASAERPLLVTGYPVLTVPSSVVLKLFLQ